MHNEANTALRGLLIAALLALSGCVFTSSRPQALITAVAPDTVRVGDSVAVRVTVQNVSKRPLWFEGNHCYGVFQALSGSGQQVGSAYEGLACALYSIRVRIDPGRKHEHLAYWLGYSLMPPAKRVAVAPGTYRIVPMIACCSPDVVNGWVPVRTVGSNITVVQ